MAGRTDTATRFVPASADALTAAFLDADALMAWLPPTGMRGRALLFEPWEGGRYRIELTYEDLAAAPGGSGKSSVSSDISEGTFLVIEPGRRIVQQGVFETDDPAFGGTMSFTWTFEPMPEGTQVTVVAKNVPAGISAEDHEAGLAASLDNLARYMTG